MQESFTMMMVQSIAALALVLAIFAGVVWLLKRLQRQYSPLKKIETIRVLQRISLDSQHTLVEVLRDDKLYILGLSNGHMQLIDKVSMHSESVSDEEKKTDV